ncbi:MAG: Outer membrane efflux protein [Pelotomaculum sp. PtaB.Bin104]|nr:MAG: Outer membrane efflux protein [Pelotomaculum sp. PtaB.Bin104]
MRRILFILSVMLAVLFQAYPILAADGEPDSTEPQKIELSISKAVEMAKNYSSTLQSAKLDIERKEIVRDDASQKLQYTPTGSGNAETSVLTAFSNLISADLNWSISKKTHESQIDTLEYTVNQYYSDLLRAQEKLKAGQYALKNAEQQVKVARISCQFGLISKSALVASEAALEKARANMEEYQKQLDDSYQKFNQYIGLQVDARPVLTDTFAYKPIEIESIDAEVGRVLAESPSVWLADRNVDVAKQTRYYQTPYDVGKIDVQKAELSATKTRDTTKQTVRSLYLSISQMEDQYNNLSATVETSEEDLRVLKVKYQIGMATEAEVISAESSLAQAKQALFDLVCRHAISKLAFEKPWASSGSSSAQSSSSTSS